MNKKNIAWIAIGVALAAILIVSILNSPLQGGNNQKPTPLSAGDQMGAPTPEDDREIAVLTLAIHSSPDGKVESVELERARIIKSYAPNVFGRPGEWTIELVGREQTVTYAVLDPRYVEVENEPNAESPFTYIIEPSYEWEVVIPLFDDGQDLQVQNINIYDSEGNQIFETVVDREQWRQ